MLRLPKLHCWLEHPSWGSGICYNPGILPVPAAINIPPPPTTLPPSLSLPPPLQFSPLTDLAAGSWRGHDEWFSRDSLPVFSAGGPCQQSGMGRDVHSAMLSMQHFIAEHGITHPPRCPEGWFWRGCRGMSLAWTMQVMVSWQLPEKVPVDPQGSWSCSTPSHWSCTPSRRRGEVSLGTYWLSFERLDPFFRVSMQLVHVSQP